MAITRYGIAGYGMVEKNAVNSAKNGLILSQLPLDATEFLTVKCENGMWLQYDMANEAVFLPAVTSKGLSLVATSEALYNQFEQGLENFYQIGGQYPRLYPLGVNDRYTTNCFSFDTASYADEAAVVAALGALDTEVYVVPGISGVPTLADAVGSSVTYGKVVKYYTMPDGTEGIKIQILAVG
jgi:hypothetical protein